MTNLLKLFFASILLTAPVAAQDLCHLATDALQIAETIRELKIKRPVNCKVQNKEEVERYLRETIDTKIPNEKIEKEEKLFKILGLIPRNYQYKEELIKLYTGQLAGYYEPVSEYYVMAGWMPEMMQMPIAVHELTHALQDQHYNLDEFLDAKSFTSDQALARSAVVEGDASIVMYDYFNDISGKPSLANQADIRSLVFQSVASSNMLAGFKEAPRAMQAFLLFPYTSGLNFSHQILRKDGYSGLNKVFGRVPSTTKEILHPDYYQQGVAFKELTFKDITDFFELKDFEVDYYDRLGEFILSTMINQEDETLASSWNNDLAVFGKNSDRVYWLLKLQTTEKARQLETILKKINPNGIKKSIIKNEFLGLILE